MLHETLKNKPASERAKLKGQEIARQVSTLARTQRQNYDIEIVEVNAIEKGVEVYARAWQNGEQIGFGRDGTVDIERFVIINPPILVRDPSGDVVRVQEAVPDLNIDRYEIRYREDVQEALLQVLGHNLSVMKNTHPSEKIVRGKRGNTTTTVFPDADTESTSVDGYVNQRDESSWDAAHDSTGTDSASDDGVFLTAQSRDGGGGTNVDIRRIFILFDTSSIPDTDTISSATLSAYEDPDFSVSNGDDDGDDFLSVITTTPASNTALVAGDFDQVGTTEQHDTGARIDLGSVTLNDYNDWSFNATGISNISKTGISKFGIREGHDLLDNPIANGTTNQVFFSAADQTGTSQDPKLVVEHTTPVARRVFIVS